MSTIQTQVIIKAYYNDLEEQHPEIRRFSIDISPRNDAYQALETTIAQLNNNYVQGQFTLQYVDEDNDRITFSSDGEFRAAINQIGNGTVMKIFVKPKAKPAASASASASTNSYVHLGVVCDGCNGSVIGNRFKCMQCPDYDLCQSCSDKNVHPAHNMMKMTGAASHPFAGCGQRGGRGPFAGGRWGSGRCGGARRFWSQFMHQQQQQQQNNQGGPEVHFPFPNHMVDFLSQFKGKELAELVEAHLPEYLRTEKVNQMLNEFKTGEQADKIVDHHVLLEYVGRFLREVLSPLGIDCDYFVDGQQGEKSAAASASAEQPQTKETAFEASTAASASASASASTEPKPSAPPHAEATSNSAQNQPSFGNLLSQLQSILNPGLQYTTAASNSNAAKKVDEKAEEDKKIQECIERMTAMGFVDSNGVLTELIKAKKGDLNQVLDALNPRNYKS